MQAEPRDLKVSGSGGQIKWVNMTLELEGQEQCPVAGVAGCPLAEGQFPVLYSELLPDSGSRGASAAV